MDGLFAERLPGPARRGELGISVEASGRFDALRRRRYLRHRFPDFHGPLRWDQQPAEASAVALLGAESLPAIESHQESIGAAQRVVWQAEAGGAAERLPAAGDTGPTAQGRPGWRKAALLDWLGPATRRSDRGEPLTSPRSRCSPCRHPPAPHRPRAPHRARRPAIRADPA